MTLEIEPNSVIRIPSVQPHNISLSKDSIDYLNNTSNSSALFKSVEVIKLDDKTYFCENGNHRLYCLAKRGYDECPVRLYDINIEEDRLLLAQNRRERRKSELLIDNLSDAAKAFFEEMNPPAKESDIRHGEIKRIYDTINFVRSRGICVITDLEGKFLQTRSDVDAEFNMKYMNFLRNR